jgi:hypothetical protein
LTLLPCPPTTPASYTRFISAPRIRSSALLPRPVDRCKLARRPKSPPAAAAAATTAVGFILVSFAACSSLCKPRPPDSQLPQLRRPSAYMVCPSRQAALLSAHHAHAHYYPLPCPVLSCRTSLSLSCSSAVRCLLSLRALQRNPCQRRGPPLPPLLRSLCCHPRKSHAPFPSLPFPSYKLFPTVLSFLHTLPSHVRCCTSLPPCITWRITTRSPAREPSPSFIVLYTLASLHHRRIVAQIAPCTLFYLFFNNTVVTLAALLTLLAPLSIIPTHPRAYHRPTIIPPTTLGLE